MTALVRRTCCDVRTSNDLDHNILKDVHGGTPYVTYVLEATYVVVDMGCELRLLSEKCVPNRKKPLQVFTKRARVRNRKTVEKNFTVAL